MKTAEQLGISQPEYEALIRVRDGLRSGKYVHVKPGEGVCPAPEVKAFNMDISFEKGDELNGFPDCDQVGCIGGWVAFDLGYANPSHYVYQNDDDAAIRPLFFPPSHLSYSEVTEEQAAQAIDNFLNTGDPRWEEVVEGEQEELVA